MAQETRGTAALDYVWEKNELTDDELGRELARQGACIDAAEKLCDQRMGDLEKRIDQRIRNMEIAVEKAAVGMERRLEGMNEFRDTLRDQTATFATSNEIRMQIGPIQSQLSQLWDWKNNLAGVATQTDVARAQESANRAQMGMLIAIAIAVLSFVAKFLPWGN